jgi:hypothetical protein
MFPFTIAWFEARREEPRRSGWKHCSLSPLNGEGRGALPLNLETVVDRG